MTATTTTSRSAITSKVAKVLLSIAVVMVGASVVAVTSLALFTDSASVGANSFTTGSVDINATPASAAVSMPAMAPGDQVTNPLTVNNSGSLDLRYAMESTTTENVLAGELVLTVKSGVTACNNAGWAADGTHALCRAARQHRHRCRRRFGGLGSRCR